MLAPWILASGLLTNPAPGQVTLDVCLPTANEFLFQSGGGERFFQATVMGTWESGQYGCVRKGDHGRQFHEGIDIKCLERDRKGEPTDAIRAVANCTVAFINRSAGQSNYGRYIILRHEWDGVEVFTLYAHLHEIANGLAVDQAVAKGQVIAVMGRSSNTREGISRDRAHLHFEINFMMNRHFYRWYPKKDPKAPDFGNFNGQNFIGIDPAAFFQSLHVNPKMDFPGYLRQQPEAFRVRVPARPFSWLMAHPECLLPAKGPPTAYEIAMTYTGLPLQIVARDATELVEKDHRLPALVSVNEAEISQRNCRYLVRRVKGKWTLSEHGREW